VQEATADLGPGEYVMTCFIPTPGHDGMSHAVMGMVVPLTVVDTGVGAAAPATDATVSLRDYAVALPDGFAGGPVAVTNDGQEDHELIVMRFHEGKGVADLLAWSEGGMPAGRPFDYVGGVGTIPPGATAWADLDLGPGDYIALCVVPGPGGVPHVEMGMATPFTVA
jgi:hypothetical protein